VKAKEFDLLLISIAVRTHKKTFGRQRQTPELALWQFMEK